MQPEEVKAEIAALEIQFHQLDTLLDYAIKNNEALAKLRIIFHDLKLAYVFTSCLWTFFTTYRMVFSRYAFDYWRKIFDICNNLWL